MVRQSGLDSMRLYPAFLFVLTVVVFFHELGHFLVARWCGVSVKVFSVGFGPELLGFNDRKGTRWKLVADSARRLRQIPGRRERGQRADRAALAAMNPADRARTFAGKSVGARAAIVAAGPIANFILAIVIFTGIFSIYGRETHDAAGRRRGRRQRRGEGRVQAGDLVVSIDGSAIAEFHRPAAGGQLSAPASRLAWSSARQRRRVARRRPRSCKEITGSLRQQTAYRRPRHHARSAARRCGHRALLGSGGGLCSAVKETWFVTERTLSYLFGVVAGRESADQLGGPIRVAEVSAQVATIGFVALDQSGGDPFDQHRPHQSVSDPDAGRRASAVLRCSRRSAESRSASGSRRSASGLASRRCLMLMIFATWNDHYSFEFAVK